MTIFNTLYSGMAIAICIVRISRIIIWLLQDRIVNNCNCQLFAKKGGKRMPGFSTMDSFTLKNFGSGKGEMQTLVMRIAQALVDNPQMVDVKEFREGRITVLTLKVSKEDVGKVIGKNGNTVSAMRTIIQAASVKNNTKTLLEIME